jgi:hypothetical protein
MLKTAIVRGIKIKGNEQWKQYLPGEMCWVNVYRTLKSGSI